MSLFKKRKNQNIRQRKLDDEEEEEENINALISKSVVTSSFPVHHVAKPTFMQIKPQISGPNKIMFGSTKNEKAKPKKEKKTAVLSFEDELEADDGIPFQEKKSSLSYKLRREMKKEKKEKKRELKEAKQKEKNKGDHLTVNELDDLGIRIVNGREAEVIAIQPGDSDDDEQQSRTGRVLNPKHLNEPNSSSSSLRSEPWKTALECGRIPDANLIHKIRKERQKAREMGNMIPLDDAVKLEKPQNRLIREDEDDMSEDEKVQFSVDQYAIDKKEREEAFIAARDNGSDHETDWEMQQLKKAGACPAKLLSESNSENGNGASLKLEYVSSTVSLSQGANYGISSFNSPWTGTELQSELTQNDFQITDYTEEGIANHLRNSLESLKEVNRRHQSEADKIIDDLVSAKGTVVSCSTEQDPLKESFEFFQDLRGYVTDLRECLNEKASEIKKLEDKVMVIYRQEAQNIFQRRRQDIKDQNNEYSPFAGKGAKGDEYRIRRAAEREGRRTRRRRERERKGDIQHHDGTSTDDELVTSLKQTMKSELAAIDEESEHIFDDVEPEYAILENVMKPFEDWRAKNRSTYLDAYASYNLSKIFSPFIRLELLLWNPLSGDSYLEIERMKWFSVLLQFGIDEDCTEISLDHLEEDPDRRLISSIVEKVILVKIKELVKCFWDPLSHSQCVRLVNLVKQMATFPNLSPSSKPLKELMQTVIAKIKDSIENDVFIPIFPKTVFESKTSGVTRFFHRQFWSAWKLLAAVLMWHKILSDKVIHELAIRSILNLYLLPALNLASEINISDCLEKARHIINILPREWLKSEDLKNGETHEFIERLVNFLVTLATKLDITLNARELREICDLVRSLGAKGKSDIMIAKYL